jgi:protein SCO1/2
MRDFAKQEISFSSLWQRARLASMTLLVLVLASCARQDRWHDTDVTGSLPQLAFDMVRAGDGKPVTGADYSGKVTLLYFGYTYCPDVCPLTLANAGKVLRTLGQDAKPVRLLFVTVDPDRDSLPVLKQYAGAFAPQVDALRGDPNALAALARRYRVAYSVKPAGSEQAYEVTHSSGIYAFDRKGMPRLLITSLSTGSPDVAGVVEDLRRLIKSDR